MNVVVGIVQCAIIILYGIILSTRKKIMIPTIYDKLSFLFVISFYVTISFMKTRYVIPYLLFNVILIILGIIIHKYKYSIFNVNENMVLSTLIKILEEKGIGYEQSEKSIKLTDYDNKFIIYKQSLDMGEINLKDIKDLPLYKEIKKELKINLKKIGEVVFPVQGAVFTGIGTLLLIIIIIKKI